MSANPRSPESGDVPEWVQKRIAEATDELYGDDNVIRWLADALSTARERADRAEQTIRTMQALAGEPAPYVRTYTTGSSPTPTPDHA